MKLVRIFLITIALFSATAAMAQNENYRIVNDNWQGLQIEFSSMQLDMSRINYDGVDFTAISIDGFLPSSEEGAPCLPLFSKLIEVPACDGFDIRLSEVEYDTIMLSCPKLMPVQPSRSKSDTVKHPLEINDKLYSTDAFYGFKPAMVERVGIARDRHLARLQFSPVSYNPVSGQLVVCRHAVVTVRYSNADVDATMSLFERYHSPHFASGALVINSLYPKSVSTAPPIRYLIVAHSSFREQLETFVQWKRRKGFITDIVYTNDPGVGTTTTAIAAYIQSQYTNATASNPAPTYLLIVGDHEQIPAFTGTTDNDHITDLYYISWTTGDNIPDCYCGRFSAQTLSELTPQVQKTLMYEQYTFADPSFLDRAILIAGVDGGSSGDYGYTHADPAMDYAATHYINSTNGFTQVMYFKNNTSIVPSATGVTIGSSASSNSATVRGYYNQGAGFINYSAHGSATSWGTPNFTTTHVASMTNSQKFGLMIGNCCLTNKFQVTNCFGESLLRKDNYCGAVGYIGGSNSTYWNEDFYWAVGLRSGISATMSMAYNSTNLGAYDRLCHTHGEAYNQWAMSQAAIMMVGNLAVESSTTSRKLYYWEIYHLMGDPSVMPYLTQAPTMTVTAPSVIVAGSNSLAVSAAPYAYIALTNSITHSLIAATYANSAGNATLSLPSTLPLGTYELAASAQQYQTSFTQVTAVHPSGRFPVVMQITSANDLEAGATETLSVYVSNLGDVTADNVTVTLTSSDSGAVTLTPSTLTISSIPSGDTVIVTCQAHVSNNVADGTNILIASLSTCTGLTQSVEGSHPFTVIAPAVSMDMSQSSLSVLPDGNATITAVISNSGHATLSSDRLAIASPTRLLGAAPGSSDTSALFTLAPGASTTVTFTLHADSQIPTGVFIPLTINHLNTLAIQPEEFNLYIGNNPLETFEANTFHTTGWTQGTYPWTITNSGAYSGTYCLRSTSSLTHSQTAQISIGLTLTAPDSISFYYSVSSETNYDKFHFLIDNTDMIIQSGEVAWTRAAFPVTAGTHTFTFTYAKDGSVNRNSDCAWIDNVTLPHQAHSISFSNLNLCEGDSYSVDNTTLNTTVPGENSLVLTSSNGDVQIVDYMVYPTYNTEQELAVCDSFSMPDSIYTVSTDLLQSLTTVHGCDSLALLHLTVHYSYAGTVCDTSYSDSYQWNDSTYIKPGSYTQYFSTMDGCDSIVTLQLTFVDTTHVVGFGEIQLEDSPIRVYPNPTQGVLSFDRTVEEAVLFDATGRAVMRRRQASGLDFSQLPNGIYMLRLISRADGISTVVRVVKK